MKRKFKRIPNDRDFRRLLDEMGRVELPGESRGRKVKRILLFLAVVVAIGAAVYFFEDNAEKWGVEALDFWRATINRWLP